MCMCLSCARYASFIAGGKTKSLEDYLALFRRCVLLDILLAVAYVASAVATYKNRSGAAAGDAAGVASTALLVGAVSLWLLDAGLLLRLGRSAKAAAGEAEALASLICLKRIVVATSSCALLVYLARLLVEVSAVAGRPGPSDASLYTPLILGALIVTQKVMRMLAVNSFGAWLGAHAEGEAVGNQNCADGEVPGGQDSSTLAV